MTPEKQKKLNQHLQGIAEILYEEADETQLTNLAGIEKTIREQTLEHITPELASPVIKAMHELKEEFIRVFDKSKNLGEGTFKLIEWLKKAEPFFKETVKTIKTWFPEIVGYFEHQKFQ
jgi:transposase